MFLFTIQIYKKYLIYTIMIKSFKIFEMTVPELSNEIDDFLLYFEDEGYQSENRYRYGGGISIYRNHLPINQWNNEKTSFKNISDDLLRLVEYLLLNVKKVIIDIEMIFEKFTTRFNTTGYDTSTIGFIIHRSEEDWEDRILKEIGLNTKIRSISIQI
jgi:hypothetical protein